VSSVSAAQVATSLTGFVVFYTALLVVDVVLMRKYIRLGPDGLGMWRSTPVAPTYPARAD
jgi:cytochrome d ubiquinol oxidase subunit I